MGVTLAGKESLEIIALKSTKALFTNAELSRGGVRSNYRAPNTDEKMRRIDLVHDKDSIPIYGIPERLVHGVIRWIKLNLETNGRYRTEFDPVRGILNVYNN